MGGGGWLRAKAGDGVATAEEGDGEVEREKGIWEICLPVDSGEPTIIARNAVIMSCKPRCGPRHPAVDDFTRHQGDVTARGGEW